MYYLYRHIRLDNNEPFYIGIGTCNENACSFKREHKRAFETCSNNRSSFWKNITNKTKYRVEILYYSENYNFILEKEKEFIKLYGRKDLNKGSLCNLTDGGEGAQNTIISKETRQKMRISTSGEKHPFYGKKRPKEVGQKVKKALTGRTNTAKSKPVFQINVITDKIVNEFPSIAEARRITGTNNISRSINRNEKAGGYFWRFK